MLTINIKSMHKTKRAARKILALGIIVMLAGAYTFAQDNPGGSAGTTQVTGTVITGTIKDASTGNPLNGINVTVTGYSATLTDEKGWYSVNVPDMNATIIVSGPGFQKKEVALKGRTTIDVNLYEDAVKSVYDEARMPYGRTPLNRLTHAVTSINTGGNWERTNETPDTYLQGRVSGLDVVRRSGTSAIGANMFLRGFSSLYATSQPLVVVDGVIYDINSYGNSLITGHVNNPLADIDVKDIDNITVIKDGASIYGTKGANGVILITTGKAEDVATKIDFAAYVGFNSAVKKLPVMKAADYRTYLSDVLKSGGMTDDEISVLPYMNDDTANPDYYRFHNETDWQDEVLGSSVNQNYHLKITGGDDIATYALSLGTTSSKGIIKTTGLNRYFMRFNADLKLTAKMTANANLSFTSSDQVLKDQGLNIKTNPLYLGLVKAPILPAYQLGDDGSQSPNLADADVFGVSNPAVVIDKIQDINKNYRFTGMVAFNYALNNHVDISTVLGVTFDKVRERFFVPMNGIVHDTLNLAVATNRSGSNVLRLFTLYNDTRISYHKTFNFRHNLAVSAGLRYSNNNSQADYGLGYNSATDDFVSVGNGINTLRKVGGETGDWNWLNMYLDGGYSFLNKYFLSLDAAVDGSSRFGENNRYAFLPSAAAGWLLSSEDFMSSVSVIDLLKLRVSYGLVGNDDIGNYTSRKYYVSQNLLGMQGLVRGNIGNPDLKWETVSKFDAGADAALFDDKVNASVDFFINNTSDMITYEPVNSATGFDFVVTNGGAMKTTGLEVDLNGRVLNRTLKLDLGLNLMTYRSEITELPQNEIITEYGGALVLSQVGKESNLFLGYETEGVIQSDDDATFSNLSYRNKDGSLTQFQAGDMRFIDKNYDHVIDEADMTIIGNPNPDLTGAVSAIASWKRFSFDALFTFSLGNDIYNYPRRVLESVSGPNNQTLAVINRWRADGQETNIPRASWGDPSGSSRFSDRWIEDGSYLRLRTVSLAYDIPFKEGTIIRYAKVYATANNLFTLTGYLGYDPEFSSSGSIFAQGIDTGLEPQFKTFQLGVRIGF